MNCSQNLRASSAFWIILSENLSRCWQIFHRSLHHFSDLQMSRSKPVDLTRITCVIPGVATVSVNLNAKGGIPKEERRHFKKLFANLHRQVELHDTRAPGVPPPPPPPPPAPPAPRGPPTGSQSAPPASPAPPRPDPSPNLSDPEWEWSSYDSDPFLPPPLFQEEVRPNPPLQIPQTFIPRELEPTVENPHVVLPITFTPESLFSPEQPEDIECDPLVDYASYGFFGY